MIEVDALNSRELDAISLDKKLTVALGMGVDACDRTLAAGLLYDSIYFPDKFNDPTVAAGILDDRYPSRLESLAAPLSSDAVGLTPARDAFVGTIRRAITAHPDIVHTSYPNAIQTLWQLACSSQVVVWTQGDPAEQYRKMAYTGVGDVRRRVVAERGDEITQANLRGVITAIASTDKMSDSVLDRLAALHDGRQVFILEDRVANLSRILEGLGERGIATAIPIWVQQGRRGHLSLPGMSETEARVAYNAVDSITDVPERIARLRNPKLEPLVISDFDDVITDGVLQARLQANSVRKALTAYGMDPAVTDYVEPWKLIWDHRPEDTATTYSPYLRTAA